MRRSPVVPASTLAAMVIAALATIMPARADIDVHASLSRESVEVGETTELTVALTGTAASVDRPEIPRVDGLEVVSSSSQSNIQFTNGRMNSVHRYTFNIRPVREGTFTIPAIGVRAGRQTHMTEPLELRVVARSESSVPPAAPPVTPSPEVGERVWESATAESSRGEIVARLTVDDPEPWVGQQVTLTLSFYQAHTLRLLGKAEYTPPDTEGLIAEPLPNPSQRTETIDGVPYEIVQRRQVLMAPTPGEYEIGAAKITFMRGYATGEETISTESLTLRVRPLPESGRPEGFSGAVGRLHSTLEADVAEVAVGEAATLRLVVTGLGNLRQLEAPELPVSDSARVIQGGEERQIGPRAADEGYAIGGTVAFDYLVMPQQPGTLKVGPVTVHYFNPDTRRYEQASTSRVRVGVTPGAGAVTRRPEGEIRHIRTSGLATRARRPVTSSGVFWALQALPLLGLGWALRRRSELLRRARDPRYRRFVEAARRARSDLAAIRRTSEPREVYERADEVLTEYIAAKTRVAAASLGPEQADRRLADAGVGENLRERAVLTLRRLRAGLYAPGASEALPPETVSDEVAQLIDELEERLG